MGGAEAQMDAIIRTYEHSLVKVTVFASHRSPSCASGFPASPPPSPTDDLKAPPVSPPRLSRASSSPLCPPSIYGGGPLSLSLGSFSERARTPPDDSEEMECVGGVWITPGELECSSGGALRAVGGVAPGAAWISPVAPPHQGSMPPLPLA